MDIWNYMNGIMAFGTNNTEQVRIDNQGSWMHGVTSFGNIATMNDGFAISKGNYMMARTTEQVLMYLGRYGTTGNLMEFFYSGTNVAGSISVTGATTCSFNTSSDHRLKTNIRDVADERALDDLMRMSPKLYEWRHEPGTEYVGFIAHELQTVAPQAVSGVKDEVNDDGEPVHQLVDYSKVTPYLAAALQAVVREHEAFKKSALEEIGALKRRITILEGSEE
jgi:hypothetical protein